MVWMFQGGSGVTKFNFMLGDRNSDVLGRVFKERGQSSALAERSGRNSGCLYIIISLLVYGFCSWLIFK